MTTRTLAFFATFFAGGLSMAFAADRFVVEDQAAFATLVPADATVEKLAGGFEFTEGPVWVPDPASPDGGFLPFSDQPSDSIRRWSKSRGDTVFRQPADRPNGHALDLQGDVIGCQQRPRRVARLEKDLKTWTPLVERWDGRRFNSPNDVTVKRDGTIWFTDPSYGLPKGEQKEMPGNYVFRFDPTTKRVAPVVTTMRMPNGLCFSPDERLLYVAESQWDSAKDVRLFDVSPDGATLSNERRFCQIDNGVPDGMRVDQHGNLWSSAADGVHVFDPSGKRLGKILAPETVANLVFGGPDGKTLFLTASKSLYSIRVNVTGADRR